MRTKAVAALSALVWLGGCAGGLPGLSPGGLTQLESQQQTQTAMAADFDPKDTPPLPARRPGQALAAGAAPRDGQPGPARPAGFMGALSSLVTAGLASEAEPSDRADARDDPVTVYARIASGIKSCWLNRVSPVLPNHKFHADASPSGEASIIIYEKVQDATLGVAAFRIRIERDGRGASVRSENVRLPDTFRKTMLRDVASWTAGTGGCATRHAAISDTGAAR